jgi:hypothetical protein
MNDGSARLEVVAGNARGTSILVEDELVIGRLAHGPGRLADDDEISRSHARISYDPGGALAIEDLGSTNGSYVNGLRISAPVTLAVGDTIELGTTTLVVRAIPESEPEPPSAPPGPNGGATPRAGTPVAQKAISVAPPEPAPAEAVPPEPAPAPPEPVPAVAALSALGLRFEVDFAAHEASIQLDGGAKVRFLWLDDAWQIAPGRDDAH